MIALFFSIHSFPGCAPEKDRLIVDILDIGKADCIILRHQDLVCMIDTGEEENYSDVRSFLLTRGIQKIDALIISHFDKDHVGGAAKIISDFEIGEVYLTTFEKDSEYVQRCFEAMDAKEIEPNRLTADLSLEFGSVFLTLSPPKEAFYPEKEDNNASMVVSAVLGNEKLLFCGDAMEERIRELLKEDVSAVDFMKIPYHGNSLGNLDQLLDLATPKYCAITCSKKNPPAEDTLALLDERNVKTFLTEDGSVHVTVTPTSLSVSQD